MATPTFPVTTKNFNGPDPFFPPEVLPGLLSAIVGGNPLAASLTRFDANNGRAAFGIVSDIAGAAWTKEGEALPDNPITGATVVATAYQLGGIAMLSNRSIRDAAVDLFGEVQRVLRDYFNGVLDDGLAHGSGVDPNPLGLMSQAPAAAGGTDLWTAAWSAIGEISAAGGVADTIALSVEDTVAEASRLDGDQKPLYPGGFTQFGPLNVVTVPALAAGESLVYDAAGVFLVVGSDFAIQPSTDYAPAYSTNSTALRTVGEFTAVAPIPAKSIRKTAITPGTTRQGAKTK